MLRSSIAVCSLSVLLPATAFADGAPATWTMSRDELQAIGLGQDRGMPVPTPAPTDETADLEPKAAKQGVVFVSFEAINLQQGFDDSHNNMSGIFGGQFAAFGGDGSERAAVMDAVRTDWEPYNVLIVDTRPASGDYTMNVTSPTNPIGQGVLGIAPLDCDDMQTHNNITFAFHGANDGFGPSIVATTIGQEVAHSYGLEHVDEPGDIMNPYNAGGDPSFRDQCIQIVQGGQCAAQHALHCGSGQSQNSHLELLELFGTSVPDTQAPLVQITSPADGDMFEVGAEFRIEAMVSDDQALAQVQLYDGETFVQDANSEPYGWDVVDISEGVYEFTVRASDPAGNESVSNLVTVYIGVEPPTDDGTGDATGDDGDSDGDADDSDGDGDGDSDGTGGGTSGLEQDGGGDDGCGCREGRSTPLHAFAFGIVVLAAARRRRA
jgi:hypothetical protein